MDPIKKIFTFFLGSFSRDGVGPIVRIEGIMNAVKYRDILEMHMLPHAQEKMPADWVFQQDNDPKHTSRLVKQWLQMNNVVTLDWPSQSPDINPIEHLWEEVDRRLRTTKYSNLKDLMAGIEAEWKKIPINRIVKLVDSMPSRCQAVIRALGFATKY